MMNFSVRAICTALCGVALQASLTVAQTQNTAPPAVKGVQPQNGTNRNGQPQTRGSADRQSRSPVQVKFGPPKISPKVTNPRAALDNAAIIAVLKRQREAADVEAAQMKVGARPAGHLQPMSAPGASRTSRTTAPAPTNIQKAPGVGAIGAGRVSDVQGNNSAPYAQMHPIDTTAVTCANNSTPRILGVSGSASPATFTPEGKYNLYTIAGCSFGPSDPNNGNKAYLYGPNGFRQNLLIDFWSENAISAHLDPILSAGFLDQDNVTLVVAPLGKPQVEAHGYKFYAARGMPGPDGNPQEVQLKTVPQGSVSLSDTRLPFLTGYDQVPSKVASQFPGFGAFQGTPVAGWVFRYAFGHRDSVAASALCFINDVGYNDNDTCQFINLGYGLVISGAADTWDFSRLARGFTVSSSQLFTDSPDPNSLCGAGIFNFAKTTVAGTWDYKFGGTGQVVVTWATAACSNMAENVVNTRDGLAAQSSYGLAVWVLGPRCVDPWTGMSDQSCIADLKKRLGQ
jgi:hypothetical protein